KAPTVLVRRELYFPGWTAKVNGKSVPIHEYKSLFQSIQVPAGRSTVVFTYLPPHENWATAGFAIGAALVILPPIFWRRKRRRLAG
ncbi:MAG: YfhO family protein, partial [Firmicutes bacterium]|nr:YfhO family protein [Bacillota bacterium]